MIKENYKIIKKNKQIRQHLTPQSDTGAPKQLFPWNKYLSELCESFDNNEIIISQEHFLWQQYPRRCLQRPEPEYLR